MQYDPTTLPIITPELYAEFLNRVEEDERSAVVQVLRNIGFPWAF